MCSCAAWMIDCGFRRDVFGIVCHSSLLIFCVSFPVASGHSCRNFHSCYDRTVFSGRWQLTPADPLPFPPLLYTTLHLMLQARSRLPPSVSLLLVHPLQHSLIAYFATSSQPQYFASRLAPLSALYPPRSSWLHYACRIITFCSQRRLEMVITF